MTRGQRKRAAKRAERIEIIGEWMCLVGIVLVGVAGLFAAAVLVG